MYDIIAWKAGTVCFNHHQGDTFRRTARITNIIETTVHAR